MPLFTFPHWANTNKHPSLTTLFITPDVVRCVARTALTSFTYGRRYFQTRERYVSTERTHETCQDYNHHNRILTPDSVNMLLEEFNGGPSIANSPSIAESMSDLISPTKPLNFPQNSVYESEKRDFNSSSDTYVSESGLVHEASEQDSFKRNFDVSEENIAQTIDTEHTTEERGLPSKSIMKTANSADSPKKSVAFGGSDSVHLYQKDETQTSANDSDYQVAHLWTEHNRTSSENSSSPPPMPPPHASNTITGLMKENEDESNDNDNVDISMLSEYRLSHKNFSNLSLNEKLDIFLSGNSQSAHDELDEHLDRLGQAVKEETDVNIHQLSHHMDNTPRNVESPLNMLSKTQEVYLRSANSSQSSLQSLMESNRYLKADAIDSQSKGFQINDGIKGFPDYLADLLIPPTNKANVSDSSSDMFTFATKAHLSSAASSQEQFHDSFDRSYMLTEKSIMHLLNSASNLDLPTENDTKARELNEDTSEFLKPLSTEEYIAGNTEDHETNESTTQKAVSVKKEVLNGAFAEQSCQSEEAEDFNRLETEDNQIVKMQESSQVQEEPDIKEEEESYVKEEENSFVKPEMTSFIQERSFIKQEAHSGPKSVPIEELEAAFDARSAKLFENLVLGEDMPRLESSSDMQTFEVTSVAQRPMEVKLVASNLPSAVNLPTVDNFRKEEDYNWSSSARDSVNDGDDEDDTGDLISLKLDTTHHSRQQEGQNSTSTSASERFEDSSDKILNKSLAPQRVDQVVDATLPPTPIREASSRNQPKPEIEENVKEADSSVLANSSNIGPPFNIALPSIETDETSFADLTKRLKDESLSFEESVSAEHDQEPNKIDFISIWKTQQRKTRSQIKPAVLSYKVSSILNYNTADISQYEKYKIPVSLHTKKFKEINLVSHKIVDPDNEDFHVSGFLPDISHDSGFEGHFKGLMANNSTVIPENHKRWRSLGTLNVLSNIDDPNVLEPPAPSSMVKKRHSMGGSLKPTKFKVDPSNTFKPTTLVKRSKFLVPSFEIKRSDSLLSPKNQYNEIFEDGSFVEPTIKAPGMKTLPSMDRGDVKRIMQMKHAISQEEYSRLKFVGSTRTSVVQEPDTKLSHVPQQASIYSGSVVSSPVHPQPAANNPKESDNFRHVAGELVAKPVAIDPKDQLFNDLNIFQLASGESPTSSNYPHPLNTISPLHRKADALAFPEPDPELISLPGLSPKVDRTTDNYAQIAPVPLQAAMAEIAEEEIVPPKSLEHPGWPSNFHVVAVGKSVNEKVASPATPQKVGHSRKSSPIKINSPVKLVKKGNSVTGIVLDHKPKQAEQLTDPYDGNTIINNKLREPKTHGHGLSTVSVPSVFTKDTTVELEMGPSRVISKTSRASSKTIAPRPMERGKLFLRVVGIKNINMPDLKNRKSKFSITLDNGVHCIKTPDYNMNALNVMIGKEFELTVRESLEFILTMKATYDKPKGTLVQVLERKVVKSKNRFSRLFGSKDVITTTKFIPQDVEDPWKTLVATDGSFARCYVDLEQYEDQVKNKACNFNITCFNEWGTTSDKKKRSPYPIAQLEVKMLFVPRTEPYEILPTSIKSAYESLDDLCLEKTFEYEGYLHQEGGDCESWKKRYFKLSGTSMVAHSEFSHKTRAKINLAKVIEVIYVDKENLGRLSVNYRNFSDILLVDHAFKIRFANGEIIDFGAPNNEEKQRWIRAIQEIVYRNKFRRQPWVQAMQAKNVGTPRPRSVFGV